MIEVKRYQPDEVIDQAELRAWRSNIPRVIAPNCPSEVKQFISALAIKLGDFAQTGKFMTKITGFELQLSGMKTFKNEKINPWEIYDLDVPHMRAVDHDAAMHRIFHRKGKQGLIDYVKARVKGSELERVLDILNVHVFHQERPEFKKVMDQINAAPKL